MRGAQVLPKPKAHGYAGRLGISSKTADHYLKGRYSIASSLNEGCTLRPKWRGKPDQSLTGEPRSCPTRPEAGAISFLVGFKCDHSRQGIAQGLQQNLIESVQGCFHY